MYMHRIWRYLIPKMPSLDNLSYFCFLANWNFNLLALFQLSQQGSLTCIIIESSLLLENYQSRVTL